MQHSHLPEALPSVNLPENIINNSNIDEMDKDELIRQLGEMRTTVADQEYLKEIVDEKRREIAFLQEQLETRIKSHHTLSREAQAKSDGMLYLENVVKELKQQNDLLQAAVADKTDELTRMETELVDTREESVKDKKKLQHYKKSLQEIHRNIGNFMNEEQVESPVITLQPVYETDDWTNAAL